MSTGEAAADRTSARAAAALDAERAKQRLAQRVAQLEISHYKVRLCARGHQIETHRASARGTTAVTTCPICGADAPLEAPEETARREHRAASTPRAILTALADAIMDWASYHLNSDTWTRKSEQLHEALQRADRQHDDDYSAYDI